MRKRSSSVSRSESTLTQPLHKQTSDWLADRERRLRDGEEHPCPPNVGQKLMCPSHPVETAKVVIGQRTAGGVLAFFSEPLPFPDVAREVVSHERLHREVRLAGPCVMSACSYWVGSCQLGRFVTESAGDSDTAPECSIRGQCRWFAENGEDACGACSSVTFDSSARTSG